MEGGSGGGLRLFTAIVSFVFLNDSMYTIQIGTLLIQMQK